MTCAEEWSEGRGSPEEFTEGCLSDFYRLKYAEARASFIRGCRQPCVQVSLVAKEIHQGAAHLCHTAPVPVGGPDHQSRGLSSLKPAALDIHSYRCTAEETRRANACLLVQHKRDADGINGAHGIERLTAFHDHPMCRWKP